ncbi:MAG: nucleoside-diphosphate kinase [Nitrospinae bacterium]|nr:nucleoside-diphosphate kinase [Nitrospinota bacterium]
MGERTLAIIKPDAVKKRVIGDIIRRYEGAGLQPIEMKMLTLSKKEAEEFYAVHRDRPFFDSLTSFMARGPIVVLVLEGEEAVRRYRDLMGATDPAKAESGTIRAVHGTSIEENAVHGSDSSETSKFEVGYFFPKMDINSR